MTARREIAAIRGGLEEVRPAKAKESLLDDLVAGEITDVQGALNATYDAEAVRNPSITVTAATPLLPRIFSTSSVDWIPVAEGAPCVLMRKSDDTWILWAVKERVDVSACDDTTVLDLSAMRAEDIAQLDELNFHTQRAVNSGVHAHVFAQGSFL